jgi:hypothetical protein
MRRQNK